MTDSTCRALGLDRVSLSGKYITIEERHGSDANCLISTILSRALSEHRGIILVLFHNTFGHYHNIGMKLGYNLRDLQDRGQVSTVEPMKYFVSSIEGLENNGVDSERLDIAKESRSRLNQQEMLNPLNHNENLVQHLFSPLKEQYSIMKKSHEDVTIIVDDITHLFDINLTALEIWTYTKYVNTLKSLDTTLALCILVHSHPQIVQTSPINILTHGLKMMADLHVAVEPLSTGHSNSISGIMHVHWQNSTIRKKYNWHDVTTYHFKLHDRHINLFVPGRGAI